MARQRCTTLHLGHSELTLTFREFQDPNYQVQSFNLMLLACHKQSYLMCDEIMTFWFIKVCTLENNTNLGKCFVLFVLMLLPRVFIVIFWSFLGTLTFVKDNFCFHESIFQWQIKHISHRSEFQHLRQKPAVTFSKWLIFKNYLVISFAKMQVKK